jgi:hypothetical protein
LAGAEAGIDETMEAALDADVAEVAGDDQDPASVPLACPPTPHLPSAVADDADTEVADLETARPTAPHTQQAEIVAVLKAIWDIHFALPFMGAFFLGKNSRLFWLKSFPPHPAPHHPTPPHIAFSEIYWAFPVIGRSQLLGVPMAWRRWRQAMAKGLS